MILRGAVLSKERVALRAGAPQPGPKGASGPRQASAAAAPAPAGGASNLTLEQVLTWLESRDERTRAQLTARLAGNIEQLRLAAARQGHAEGHALGLKEAQAHHAAALEVIRRAAQEAQVSLQGEAQRLAESCADIVIEVLTRMAGATLASREAIMPLVLEVLKRVQGEREVLIQVSAQDLPLLQAAEEALRSAFGGRKLTVAADARVELGGCLIETSCGSFDGRLETQLRAVFEAIHGARAARPDGRPNPADQAPQPVRAAAGPNPAPQEDRA